MSDESKEQLTSADTSKEEEKEDEEADGEDMEQDETETSHGKSADKSEEDEEEDNKDEEEEESDDEPQVGLLEKPLVLEDGKKRERKKVDRISFQPDEKAHEGFKIKEGKGRSLGDIPYIEHKLSRTKAEDAKPLHRLLFRRVGSQNEVKKNIRQFSGFPFPKDDTEYEKRVQMMKGKSFTTALLKHIMDILDIPRGGNKDELITRLMDWLEKPKDSGRKIPQPKRKRKSKGGSDKKTKAKIVKKKRERKKLTKTKETAEDDDDDDEDDNDVEDRDEDDDDEAEDKTEDSDDAASDVSDVSEEEEEGPPKKKARKATPKQTKDKKAKEKPTPKAKAPKVTPKKRATPKKKKVSSEEISDVSSDSDDEPLVTKQKSKGPPSNDELKDVIKKMLDSANLEQVTMKTVLKDVFAKYPSFDLTDRKDFIKNTVKQIIS